MNTFTPLAHSFRLPVEVLESTAKLIGRSGWKSGGYLITQYQWKWYMIEHSNITFVRVYAYRRENQCCVFSFSPLVNLTLL